MNLAESSRRFTSMRRENSRNDLEELLAIPSESLSVFELEKEIVKRRDKLLWSLRDPIIYNEFIQFMNHSKSVGFLWIINLFFSVAFIPAAMKAMYGKQDYITIWATIDFTIVTTTWLSGCLVCGCLDEKSVFRRTAKALLTYTTATSLEALADSLVAIFYLSVVIGRSLELIQRTVAGQCKTLDWSESFSCNPNANVGNFPMESFCIVASIPVFIVYILREARFYLNITAWSIALISLLFSTYWINSPQTIPLLSYYIFYEILIISDFVKQCLLFYLLSRQLKKTIETNQRLAVQNKATEMRHLIANVAHDLKTPLSSFMTGIDIISADIIECMLKLKSSPHKPSSSMIEGTGTDQEGVTKEYLTSMMSGLQSCIVNIRNTNAFMLMTINRCLDYTKASNGLKLVPKNETIDLQETINMPLQCMTNIQNKMKITLQSYEDEGICSHIITDRQWLQENLLCLLSNAVKYSGEGEVLIVVSRVTRALDRTVSGTKTNSPDDSDDYHPASPTKLCYRIEDEVITSEPDNYQSPVTMMLRQLSMAHISRKSTSSRLSMKSGQVSVMGSQWFREATSTNSRGLDVMLNSMVTKRSIISTNKVAPSPPTSPTRHTQRTVNSRQGMNQLENPSDNDSLQETEEYTQQRRRRSPRRHIPHRRMSTASNASVASQASQASSQAVSEKSFHEELMFEVIDPGIGIAEEAMKSLFNPFKQTQRLAGGTGLGLYSLAKRIEALKGKYGVHQRVDGKQGSVFWFTIPYRADTVTAAALMAVGGGGVDIRGVGGDKSGGLGVRESYEAPHGMMTSQLYKNAKSGDNNVNVMVDVGVQPQPTSIHASTPTTSMHQNQTQNLSVLIVEDTPSIAKMTSMMLKRQKHRTEVAENGQIALKMLYEEETKDVERFKKESKEGEVCSDVNSEDVRYDVVLMDLQMPVMDGLEATRRIRGREKEKEKEKMTRHQIVIGVSANSDHETMEEAFKAGIDDFLPKPFSMEAFLKAVQRIQVKLSES